MTSATSGMAANLSTAIQNQPDPGIVRDGAPAYLLMLDSFNVNEPGTGTLIASAELYAMYGALFSDDPERALINTTQAVNYAEKALCSSNSRACGLADMRFADFSEALDSLGSKDVPALYTYALAWSAYIKVNSGEMSALSKLPRAQAAFERVLELDGDYERVNIEHYLGVLDTVRPPALGGDFASGKAHFDTAVAKSGGKDLSILVDYAKYYARTLYERELHDQLLTQVLDADPVQDGYTLFNVLAQQDAQILLDSADDYF